jgi:two-component system, LytTR family, response regulator
MRCLVADDDPLVCEMVETWLTQIDGVEYCLKAEDGLMALNLVSTGEFDLVFLDLQMPGIDGETLLRSLSKSVPVIVISASGEFGARSYEFNVIDYLIKPLAFPRFFQALTRAKERLAFRAPQPMSTTPTLPGAGTAEERPQVADHTLFVKDGTRLVKIDLRELMYVKAEANYVSFVCDSQQVMSLMSMKRLEELLPESFMRIHRSWMVNRHRIQRLEDGCVIIGGQKLPVGDNYREALTKSLKVIN